jgi:hypothetical protein
MMNKEVIVITTTNNFRGTRLSIELVKVGYQFVIFSTYMKEAKGDNFSEIGT